MARKMTCITPRTDAEWEEWRPLFSQLYMDEKLPLPKVMMIMEDQHNVKARQDFLGL